ncbi:hypothetical protein DEJ48_08195 [Streptomyces venezuelae]|uniref:Uncharacterized protein n=1 Tax=Streptomyces venezuelae TaxID=54571 RepID=A0A5P2BSB0_STRVZ|nr:hypothetical protein DEJ48_08195 [Streptomyces venezuelae]
MGDLGRPFALLRPGRSDMQDVACRVAVRNNKQAAYVFLCVQHDAVLACAYLADNPALFCGRPLIEICEDIGIQ